MRVHGGQYSDVLVDEGRGLVRRYPRYEAERASIPSLVERLDAAVSLGLPAPRVLAVAADRALGEAHIVVGYVPGVGLRDPAVARLGRAGRERVAADLAHLLGALHDADLARWPPTGGTTWQERWVTLRRDVAELVAPHLGAAGAARAVADADAAVAAAALARTSTLVHGDLGGENVRVDPVAGAVTGVLDWDSAGPGDPAVDLAALSTSLPESVMESLFDARPDLRLDVPRAQAYARTFALQDVIFGLRRGDVDAARNGLAPYR